MLIGIDQAGARHYQTSPVGEVVIYVVGADGTVATVEIEKIPKFVSVRPTPASDENGCTSWVEYVDAQRGWAKSAREIEADQIEKLLSSES